MYFNFINIETESWLKEMRSNLRKKCVINYLNKYQSYWNQRIIKGKPYSYYDIFGLTGWGVCAFCWEGTSFSLVVTLCKGLSVTDWEPVLVNSSFCMQTADPSLLVALCTVSSHTAWGSISPLLQGPAVVCFCCKTVSSLVSWETLVFSPLCGFGTLRVLVSGTLVPWETRFLWGNTDCCGEAVPFETFSTPVCDTLSVCETLSPCETLFDGDKLSVCAETCISARLFSSFTVQTLVCFGEHFRVSLCFGAFWKTNFPKTFIMQKIKLSI